MRRSLAPSQVRLSAPMSGSREVKEKKKEENDIEIERLPLFGFLSIPEDLRKKFVIPSGCVITEASIALRRVKTLGYSKSYVPIRPGDRVSILPHMDRVENAIVGRFACTGSCMWGFHI